MTNIKELYHKLFCRSKDYTAHYENGHLRLVCIKCLYKTKGWDVGAENTNRIDPSRTMHISGDRVF